MKNQIVFATVSMFRLNREELDSSYGFAVTSAGQEFYMPMWACHKIVAGASSPEFSDEGCGRWPKQGDGVVILPDKREPRLGQKPCAYRWGYRRFWDRALAEIKDRPMYQVRGETHLRNGIKQPEHVVIECATAEELQAQYPRGTRNDPLGTEEPYRSRDSKRTNRCFVWEGAEWKLCADPRPLPAVAQPAPPTEEEGELTAELEELASSTSGRNRGVNNTEKRRQEVAA